MKVAGKVIVVTGAGSGIGRALTLNLIEKGAQVAGVDVNAHSLAETQELANTRANSFMGYQASVSDRQAVEQLPARVIERFGCVDGILNNAGIIQPFVRLNDLEYDTITRVLNVNLFGCLYMTKAFLPHLLTRPSAHITNLSSMGGFVPVPGQTIYCAAKAAVKLMSEGLNSELLNTNVRVTIVCPGAVATNIRMNSGAPSAATPDGEKAGKALSPARAAEIIVAGIEKDKYLVFVGKDASLIDKLYRMSPAFAARAIAKKMSALLQ